MQCPNEKMTRTNKALWCQYLYLFTKDYDNFFRLWLVLLLFYVIIYILIISWQVMFVGGGIQDITNVADIKLYDTFK